MPPLRNIALTVHELEPGEFFWVLMEAPEGAAGIQGLVGVPGAATHQSTHGYMPLEAALEPYASYSNALVAGVAAMRRLFGPEGQPTSL